MAESLTITEWVVAQARRTPDGIALWQWERRITYAELLDRAAALAAHLDAADPGDLVGVCTARSPELVVAQLGVLLSGRAYVPMDPASPPARLRMLAEQAHLTAVVADADGRAALPDLSHVDIPTAAGRVGWKPGPATAGSVAYVAFTSGSTGRPKGVVVSHANVSAFIAMCSDLVGAGPGDRMLAVISPSFDAIVIDTWVALSCGSTITMVPQEDRADLARLHRFAQAHGATWTCLTPTMLPVADPEQMPTLRTIICGGDVMTAAAAARWSGRRLINAYGPTETTVFVLHADLSTLDYEGDPPLGRPSGRHRAYVVDDRLREVPPGEPGELLIGGPGVALGYLDQPELTAERFVPDPHRPGAFRYRTGDIVQVDPSGQLRFIGRRDGQVKIRGQRVEPGEVAAVVRAHPEVRDVAVEAMRGPAGDAELVAFVATDADDETLRQYAREQLPAAMVPRFVRLTELPVAVTGKVDREALRSLAAQRTEPVPEDPIAAAWQRALGVVPEPGSDFFADGGHSVAAMKLVAELRAELRRDLVVEDVFAGRTFDAFRKRVEHAAALDGPDVVVGNPPTLSPSQRRLWFLDQLAPDSSAYNVVFAERLRGALDVAALRRALREVAERHEVLRWRIRDHGGVPYAVCAETSDVELPIVTQDKLGAVSSTVLNLNHGPVWRAALVRVDPQEHILCVVMHHAVADGWSQAPFYADLAKAYAGQRLPRPAASFSDYAVWRAARDRTRAEDDLAWWREHLASAPTVLDLPRDQPRPPVQTYTGAVTTTAFSDRADTSVRELAAQTGVTPSIVVLAAVGEALRRLTGRLDNVIGAVLADRRLAEFQDLIGFFVDIVPLRLRTGGVDFAADVRASLDELLAAQAHPGVPLERIVDGLGLHRDPSRAPLVQVLFNVFNFTQPTLELPGLAAEPVTAPLPGSPFDLTLYLVERRGRFALDAVFNPDLYAHQRITRLLSDLVTLIDALCADASRPASQSGPQFDASTVDSAAAAPPPAIRPAPAQAANPTERLLAEVWSAVLGQTVGSVGDNFFDLGGTSMAMAEVRARLSARLGRKVAMVDLFRYPNIRALATFLDGAGRTSEDPELVRAAQRAALRRSRTGRRPAREGDR